MQLTLLASGLRLHRTMNAQTHTHTQAHAIKYNVFSMSVC